MGNKKDKLKEVYDLWQETREITQILQESWASLIRSQRLILESASLAGISAKQANKMYKLQVESAQKEYSTAFKLMCELSDEYITLKLKSEHLTKN
jgi:hypothetical protein